MARGKKLKLRDGVSSSSSSPTIFPAAARVHRDDGRRFAEKAGFTVPEPLFTALHYIKDAADLGDTLQSNMDKAIEVTLRRGSQPLHEYLCGLRALLHRR